MLADNEANEWIDHLPQIPRDPVTQDAKLEQALSILAKQASIRKSKYDTNISKSLSYQIGNLVLFKTHHTAPLLKTQNKKWHLLYTGPYDIVNIPHEGCYVLANPDTLKVKGLYPHIAIKRFAV
ncbi:uncharacterized protein LOC126264109 [Schistocerca nitens]|uniref:uncharacterized protein LOC126264109 n=1 Tax=Schistocerca nitens TaxID=7011 RepID=UPI00211794B6|nr:uncharacterized protein LOC126264109 [Schistocerca nitens]